jgi:hypothetical protein
LDSRKTFEGCKALASALNFLSLPRVAPAANPVLQVE